MASIPVEIKQKIEKYLRELKKNNIPINQAYLFGSYAKGNNSEWSDIDIALVSDVFKGNRIEDKDKIRHITLSISSQLEILPFSPGDFNMENPLAKEIIETGIQLV